MIPKKTAGDRAIGLVSLLGRLWSLTRGPTAKSWTTESACHWDAAPPGNSCLQEAFLRALGEELAHAMGVKYGRGMLNVETFYDSISWDLLVAAAMRLQFPPVALYFEFLQCVAPRSFEQFKTVSEWLDPPLSVAQGLRSGARFAKLMTPSCHGIGNHCAPSHGGARLWVDDVSGTIKGSSKAIRHHLASCMITTCKELQKRRPKVADKSIVVCADLKGARAVAKLVRRAGCTVKPATRAAHLGIDFGRGRRARATCV